MRLSQEPFFMGKTSKTMNGLVIYSSKYGATTEYAKWLGSELKLQVLNSEDTRPSDIANTDYLLIGTSVYYGRFRIREWLESNATYINGKRIFMFVVSATAPEESERRIRFINENIPADIRSMCEIFFLPGRLIHEDLTWVDKMALKLAASSVKDPVKKQAMMSDIDDVKIEHLAPLLESVRSVAESMAHQETSSRVF